jgi:cytoskeletal protein RodZ
MSSVFQQLKSARDAQRLSLSDIADATRINVQFLQALEEGRTDMLPQAYVRAFLREYAGAVGLDPRDIMAQYDGKEKKPEEPASAKEIPPPLPPPPSGDRMPRRQKATFAIVLTVLALAAVVFWNLSRTPPPHETESPVDSSPALPRTTDSVRAVPEQSPDRSDSLTLVGVTTDTVWLQVASDTRKPMQYKLPPGARRSWKARDQFTISIGRPEAITLTLNNMPLGRMGGRGRIVIDSVLTRATLRNLAQERK